jgi:2-methylcitrate dehydratase PrpD
MAHQPTESKRLLSHIIADWACSLKYEHLSPEAIQAAKLIWFDSIGCALGGSQQDDAKILLAHYRAAGGDNGAAAAFAGPVLVTTGHGDVLVRRAPPESNAPNLQLR